MSGHPLTLHSTAPLCPYTSLVRPPHPAPGQSRGLLPGRQPRRRLPAEPANHGKGAHRGRRHHEAAARGRCPLRTPDPPLEPEDEAVHLRWARRHLNHPPRADTQPHRDRLPHHPRPRRRWRTAPVHRHEAAGTGPDRTLPPHRPHPDPPPPLTPTPHHTPP